jgi:phage-related protein
MWLSGSLGNPLMTEQVATKFLLILNLRAPAAFDKIRQISNVFKKSNEKLNYFYGELDKIYKRPHKNTDSKSYLVN